MLLFLLFLMIFKIFYLTLQVLYRYSFSMYTYKNMQVRQVTENLLVNRGLINTVSEIFG